MTFTPDTDPTPNGPRRTVVARSVEDLLAVVPVVLGFLPTDSVVMLTFGGARPFHARLDLPDDPVHDPEATAMLVAPARQHEVPRVALVLYTDDDHRARSASAALRVGFAEAGIEVLVTLRADGARWFPLDDAAGGSPQGTAYHVASHPFAVQAVVDGQVTHASRDDLAATLAATDDDTLAAVRDALPDWEATTNDPTAEAAWVEDTLRAHAGAATLPTSGDIARLLVALRDISVRDVAWLQLGRGNARPQVALWSEVLRQAPPEYAAAPAALLGFAAWLAGNGALAWCAVDRCEEAHPGYGLAALLARILRDAVPPSVWEPASLGVRGAG